MNEFLELERLEKQITRVIVVDAKTVGVVWVELFENHGVKSPSIHIMIGDPDYRGRGIGRSVMEAAINYVRVGLHSDFVYTRHLTNNTAITKLNKSLGFEKDGKAYTDQNGLKWQNVMMRL
jgi:RimJ/RimL family protein N-acetyltransferase